MNKGEVIKGISFDKLDTHGNIGPDLQNIFIRAIELGLSLNAMRIMAMLALNLKSRQIKKVNRKQLDIFDAILDSTKGENFTEDFSFKYSDFLPKGSKNYAQVKEAIVELQKFNMSIEFSRQDPSGKIRNYKMASAFISTYIIEERQGFIISLNYYWYRVLINITDSFNPFLKSILYSVSWNTSLAFYFFLKKCDYIEAKNKELFIENELVSEQNWRLKGIRKNLEDFKNLFRLDYKYPSDLKRKFLDPIRADFNRYSDISFNYKIEGKNILIIQYNVNHVLISEKIEKAEINKIKNALIYKIKNQKFEAINIHMMLELYLKYTYDVVIKATSKKSQLRNLIKADYINVAELLTKSYISKNKIDLVKIEYKEKAEMRTELRKLLKI